MSFIAKNPILMPITTDSPTPLPGMRSLIAKEDGWYDITSSGEINKIKTGNDSEQNIVYYDFGIIEEDLPKESDVLSFDEGIYNIKWNTRDFNYDYGILLRTTSNADDRAYLYSSKYGLIYWCDFNNLWIEAYYSKEHIDLLMQEDSNRMDMYDSKFEELEFQIGDINSALDELHSYAQDLISGGEA